MIKKLKIFRKNKYGFNIILLSSYQHGGPISGVLLSPSKFHEIGYNNGHWNGFEPLPPNSIISLISDNEKTIYKSTSEKTILIHTNNYSYSNIISSDNITEIRNDDIHYFSDSRIYCPGHGDFYKIKNVKFKNSHT